MSTVLLPFHQDERLPEDDIVLPAGADVVVVEPVLRPGTQWERLTELYGAAAETVADRTTSGAFPTVVSGDCLAALATLTGVQRAGMSPGVVWFDAHGDVHTLESSTSGYLGGMALRMILGGDREVLTGPLGLRPLRTDQAVLVDARDLDPAEIHFLADSGLRRVRIEEIGQSLPDDAAIVVHIDLDVIDSAEIPGLRFPVSGGPTADAVISAVQTLLHSGRVAALDIACPWLPAADPRDDDIRTALLARLLER